MRARVFAVAFLALVPTLTAQSERLTIRMAPAPNQTIREQMTIVVAMTTTPRLSSSDSPSVPPEQGEMKTTMDLTSTVGPIDRRGEYDARVVIEHATMTATSNGQVDPAPTSPARVDGVEPTVAFHYDSQGRMTGAIVESDTGAVDTAVTRAMSAMLATVAPITLSIGETVTVPMEMKVPLPADAGRLSTLGETRLTLTSVSFEGADRIAHLALKMTTFINQYSIGASGPQMADEMRTMSEGKMDVNIDRGIVLHNEQTTTIGDQSSASLKPENPRGSIRATVTVSMDLVR